MSRCLQLPRDPRPADHAGRLVQDLCHDRLAAGLRGLAGRAGRPRVRGSCINDHSCVNAATQYAGIAALEGPQDAVERDGAAFDAAPRADRRASERPARRACADAGGAFYAFPNIKGTGLTAREAQDRILDEAGVATVAGTSFGAYGEGYLRLSYANSHREHRGGRSTRIGALL